MKEKIIGDLIEKLHPTKPHFFQWDRMVFRETFVIHVASREIYSGQCSSLGVFAGALKYRLRIRRIQKLNGEIVFEPWIFLKDDEEDFCTVFTNKLSNGMYELSAIAYYEYRMQGGETGIVESEEARERFTLLKEDGRTRYPKGLLSNIDQAVLKEWRTFACQNEKQIELDYEQTIVDHNSMYEGFSGYLLQLKVGKSGKSCFYRQTVQLFINEQPYGEEVPVFYELNEEGRQLTGEKLGLSFLNCHYKKENRTKVMLKTEESFFSDFREIAGRKDELLELDDFESVLYVNFSNKLN